jgi:osmotically-inducible protein OsmY
MRNSRNGNGRSSRSSRQFSDQHNISENRNRDSGFGNRGDFDRDNYGSQSRSIRDFGQGSYDQDPYERYGNRHQQYGSDFDRNRSEYGNNSYTDNEGYQGNTRGNYDQDNFNDMRQGQSQRWPMSNENWNDSDADNSRWMNRNYRDENSKTDGYGNLSGGYGRNSFDERNRWNEHGASSFDPNRSQSWGQSVESMRGKGPKGYRRSDERIQEELNDRLTDDHLLDASSIEVTVKNGEVTLSGTVQSKQDKRRAEDVAESLSGVSNVENKIRLSSRSERSGERSSEARETHESERSKSSQNKNKTHQNAEV